MSHLLLNPPFADPTQPYLSLPTLKGALRARGLDAKVIDLNVEAAHWLFERRQVDQLARRLRGRSREAAARHRAALEALLAEEPSPLEVFRRRELFFDGGLYERARLRVESLFEALGSACEPFRFGFNRAAHAQQPWSIALLREYAEGEESPLADFYEELLDEGALLGDPAEIRFAGVTIAFPSQIPEALHLASVLRRRAPRAFLALGGPCAHQVLVHMEPAQRLRFLWAFDAAGLFEGEETLCELLSLLPAWLEEEDGARRLELLRDVPNLFAIDRASARFVEGPRHTLEPGLYPAPDYDDLDLDRYLAPARTLLYAPTRGCYWGKCSFCYYGLAESATARYREIPPERAAADLLRLARRHGVRDFYLSCDVLSPSYALRLAEALEERRSKLRWHCDLKIERYFTPERCAQLFRGGLRAAAFGIESGSDRILELMRKGTDRATMTEVNRSFAAAGIATQWMAFTDHPGERAAEALDTVRWIGAEREGIALFHVGRFGLEPGSHVAQEPTRYGVRDIRLAPGDELGLALEFRELGPPRRPHENARVEAELDEIARGFALRPYPWAGSISTHHSFIFFLERGPGAFRRPAGAALR